MLVGAGDDTPLGGIFMKFSERLAINDAGLVAFHAVLRNGPVAAAVFAVDNDVVRKVAAIGDGAPGGGTFSHFGPWPALDAAGTVGFVASVDAGPSPVGAFLAGSSGLSRGRGHRGSAARRRDARHVHAVPGDHLESDGWKPDLRGSPDGDGPGRRGDLPRDAVPLIRRSDDGSVHVVGRVLGEDVGRA